MEYTHLFQTSFGYGTYIEENYKEPFVSLNKATNEVRYNKQWMADWLKFKDEPLTFTILEDGLVRWADSYNTNPRPIEYSLNDGEWTTITSVRAYDNPIAENGTSVIAVSTGDKLKFRGSQSRYGSNTNMTGNYFETTCKFDLSGNIMSLVNTEHLNSTDNYRAFGYLFRNCRGLIHAHNLVLPDAGAEYAFCSMFAFCENLKTPPLLPAMNLTEACYLAMFSDCTSLEVAPELPATILANACYQDMFGGCSSLIVPPALPAKILSNYCYMKMFENCSSLQKAPELQAKTLKQGCYYQMFNGCTNLKYIKCLAKSNTATECTYQWVKNVNPSGTFYSAIEWTEGVDGKPANWISEII